MLMMMNLFCIITSTTLCGSKKLQSKIIRSLVEFSCQLQSSSSGCSQLGFVPFSFPKLDGDMENATLVNMLINDIVQSFNLSWVKCLSNTSSWS